MQLRTEYKKILKSQDTLVAKCMSFLKGWKLGGVQSFEEGEMKWVKRTRAYLNTLEQAHSL